MIKKIKVKRKRRRVMEMMILSLKDLRLDLLKLSKNSMNFTKITMMYGPIEMKVRTISNIMMYLWVKKKSCQWFKRNIKNK